MGTVSNIMTDDNLIPMTTTDAGIGAPSDEFSLTAGAEGHLVLQDHYLIQKMAHLKTEQGGENFTDAEAKATTAEDPDFHRADLWNAIERGDHPIWRLEMQIIQFEDAADYRFNPFDVTKIWPHSDYPMIPIGRMVLDRNPNNYFAQVEQAAFEPSNMVPGIAPSPDKMLQGRLFSYPDTHRYRIGPNYLQLPVNQPLVPVHSY